MARTPEQIRKSYDAKVRELRGRRDLSPEGLQRQLAKAFETASQEMKALRRGRAEDTASRRDALLLRLFKNPTGEGAVDAISMRDAQDRAARVKTVDEALDLIERARIAGDTALQQAVAMHAAGRVDGTRLSSKWGSVLEQWATVSGRQDVYGELTEVEREQRPRTGAMFEFHLQRPSEVPVGSEVRLASGADDLDPEESPGERAAREFGWGRPLSGPELRHGA